LLLPGRHAALLDRPLCLFLACAAAASAAALTSRTSTVTLGMLPVKRDLASAR